MNNDILHIAFIGMGYRGKQLLSLINHEQKKIWITDYKDE
jgi:predicted dinucleotide-utilizing enzyme